MFSLAITCVAAIVNSDSSEVLVGRLIMRKGTALEKRVLVIESGDPSFRGYILRALYNHGFKIVLLKQDEPTWERDWIEDCLVTDLNVVQEVLCKVQAYHTQKKLQGVFTYIDLFVQLAATLSEAIGLSFYTEETAMLVRNKYLMRKQLQQCGLLQPPFTLYEHSLAECIARTGLPAVVKPLAGHSSINVIKLDQQTNIQHIESFIQSGKHTTEWFIAPNYLVEGYIDGQEVSIESLVVNGDITHIAITDKFKSSEPFFEEVGHTVPSALPEHIQCEIYKTATQGIQALKLNNCAVHTEIRLSQKGPTIIEVNGRLGGDKIPYLVSLARGIDMAAAAGYASLPPPWRQSIDLHHQADRFASIAFFTPTRKQTIARVPRGQPDFDGVIEFEFWGEVGQVVAPPPEQFFTRLGLVVVVGDTYEQSRNLITRSLQWLEHETGVEYCSGTSNDPAQ